VVNDPSIFLSFLGGTILPLIIAYILAYNARTEIKTIVAFLVCVMYAALSMWLSNKFFGALPGMSRNDFLKVVVENIGAVLMSAWTTFEFFWKQTGIAGSLNVASSPFKVGSVSGPPSDPPAPSPTP
jgi:amino acid permease